MIRLLIIYSILLISVLIGVELSHDAGKLVVIIDNWTIETTLLVALLTLILAFFVLHMVVLMLSFIMNSPRALRLWNSKRRAQKAQAQTQKGLIEFSEGYWAQAKNHLIKALPDSESPLLNYLTAARAAQELGDNTLRDSYLREAQQCMPDAKIAIELTQAQLQLANNQWEQALATLRHLHDLAPRHPYVLKLLIQLYKEVRDWSQLIHLLPEIKKNHVISAEEFDALCHETYLQAILELSKSKDAQAMLSMVNQLPKPLQHDPEIIAVYASFLINHGEHDEAERILNQTLKKNFNEKLILLYGQLKLGPSLLSFAESLIKKYPHSAALYLCLGHLSMNNDLWGKAKSYLEKSINLVPRPEAYAELGHLLEKLNDQNGALQAYRQGLALM